MDDNEIKRRTTRQQLISGLGFMVGLFLGITTINLAIKLFSVSGADANAPALRFFPFLILLADPLGIIMTVLSITYLKKNYHCPDIVTRAVGLIGILLCLIPVLLTVVMGIGNYDTYNNSWNFFFL